MDKLTPKISSRRQSFTVGKVVGFVRVPKGNDTVAGFHFDEQEQLIRDFAKRDGLEVTEVISEVADGDEEIRPMFNKALATARRRGAALVVARLDRLSTDVNQISELMTYGGVPLITCESGKQPHILVSWAPKKIKSEAPGKTPRKKSSYSPAKPEILRQNYKKGNQAVRSKADLFALQLLPTLRSYQEQGITSFYGLAQHFNMDGIRTARGGDWTPMTLKRLIERLDKIEDRNREAHGVDRD